VLDHQAAGAGQLGADIAAERRRPLQVQTAFLFTQTTRAFLYGGQGNFVQELMPPQVQLINLRGQIVGYLQLHNKDDSADFRTEAEPNHGRRVELVATSKGYTGKIYDWELAEATAKASGTEDLARQLKDCYFVLWIEWENGVAYRRGAGAVTVEVWDVEKEAELVDLILG
jgi:hypothetical protein